MARKFVTLEVKDSIIADKIVSLRVNTDHLIEYKPGAGNYTMVTMKHGERAVTYKVMMPISQIDALVGL